MEGEYSKLIATLFQRARQDSKYKKMGEEYSRLEEHFLVWLCNCPRNLRSWPGLLFVFPMK